MKKIYTVAAALVLISFSARSQQNSGNVSYANNGIQIQHNSSVQMNIIGNPARDVVTLQISNPNTTKYELSLFSSTGRKVSTTLYDHPAGVSTKTITVAGLQRGMYFLVATGGTEKRSLQVLLQ